MGSEPSVRSWLVNLGLAKDSVPRRRAPDPGGGLPRQADHAGRPWVAAVQLAARIGAAGMPGRPARGRPALDDLEPWAASSFDEIVLACDLNILTDED